MQYTDTVHMLFISQLLAFTLDLTDCLQEYLPTQAFWLLWECPQEVKENSIHHSSVWEAALFARASDVCSAHTTSHTVHEYWIVLFHVILHLNI